ncbi:conserved hypothetical protein, partial [Ricinus communis]
DAEGAGLAARAREVLVLQHLVAEDLEVALDHRGIEGLRIGHLQVGPAAVHLERLQRRVVERAFVGRRQAGREQLGLGAGQRDVAAVRGGERAEVFHRRGRDHREDRMPVGGKVLAHRRVVGREARFHGRQQEQVEIGRAGRDAEVQRRA